MSRIVREVAEMMSAHSENCCPTFERRSLCKSHAWTLGRHHAINAHRSDGTSSPHGSLASRASRARGVSFRHEDVRGGVKTTSPEEVAVARPPMRVP
ncbi:hypothetical protein D9M72_104990 [compost metagenome]